jgi:hypothetical protein
MRKGEREGTPLNKNATVVSLRENNTFIITAHCGVWFQRESWFHRERERVTLRENNTFIITAHCGVWFHRERERVSLRENNTFNNNNNNNTFE